MRQVKNWKTEPRERCVVGSSYNATSKNTENKGSQKQVREGSLGRASSWVSVCSTTSKEKPELHLSSSALVLFPASECGWGRSVWKLRLWGDGSVALGRSCEMQSCLQGFQELVWCKVGSLGGCRRKCIIPVLGGCLWAWGSSTHCCITVSVLCGEKGSGRSAFCSVSLGLLATLMWVMAFAWWFPSPWGLVITVGIDGNRRK